jgi:two-component system nitrogen regulation response regulator NtrX
LPQERILVVDDETNIANSLKEILSDEGYDVSVTEDGLNALDMIQSDPPDLLLLDVWLPGMDGIEVLKTVKTYHPEIEVLVMSGHGTIDTAVKATKLGAFDFIEKPFSMDSLTQSVKSALGLKKKRPIKINNEALFGFSSLIETQKAIKSHSQSDSPLLFLGEPGTGKEYIAQAIHQKSKKQPSFYQTQLCFKATTRDQLFSIFVGKKISQT